MRTGVLVVGSGVAGTCAALAAAPNTNGVILACKGALFSGSSFYGGTWGLGLVGPNDPSDVDNLVETIQQVGCNATDPLLVRSFVEGINPAIEQLEKWGVTLKRANAKASKQREYIPCFDHKHRAWHGIERAPYVSAMEQRLREAAVEVRSGWELLGIRPSLQGGGTATFFDASTQQFQQVNYGALVLCCGGTGTLYSKHLTQDDNAATVQGLAAEIGCQLTNMAFIQFMPGFVSPVQGIIFNEKAWRFMQLPAEVVDQLGGPAETARLLDIRSGHGPFTCRLHSKAIDFCIHEAGAAGLTIKPNLGARNQLPEFMQTYFSWLENSIGLQPNQPLRVAMYAHANNGGIAIDCQGATSVPGIFAAGECTGGMHGADRLGGLSSANGLVFGLRAGAAAAEYAQQHAVPQSAEAPTWVSCASHAAGEIEEKLLAIMDKHCSIIRTEQGLLEAQAALGELEHQLEAEFFTTTNATEIAKARRCVLRLKTAQQLVSAMLSEPTSRGSHYRI